MVVNYTCKHERRQSAVCPTCAILRYIDTNALQHWVEFRSLVHSIPKNTNRKTWRLSDIVTWLHWHTKNKNMHTIKVIATVEDSEWQLEVFDIVCHLGLHSSFFLADRTYWGGKYHNTFFLYSRVDMCQELTPILGLWYKYCEWIFGKLLSLEGILYDKRSFNNFLFYSFRCKNWW